MSWTVSTRLGKKFHQTRIKKINVLILSISLPDVFCRKIVCIRILSISLVENSEGKNSQRFS
jgi:hypothetical protein